MTAPQVTAPEEPADDLERANHRIREAAKWLLASSAAVGAALIAGSQLSNIGRLDVGLPTTLELARLWIAVFGAVVGLAAVVYTIFTAVQILLPRSVLVAELDAAWTATENRRRHPLAPVARFFREHPKYLQGFGTPAELIAHRDGLLRRYHDTSATDAELAAVEEEIRDADARIDAVEGMATHEDLKVQFRAALRRLLVAAGVTAFGIVAFAWAANPPEDPAPAADLTGSRLVGAFLRDADLRNAKLDGADLTRADLTGADLTGASLTGVIWGATICPDGTNSDQVGDTCAGHLQPAR